MCWQCLTAAQQMGRRKVFRRCLDRRGLLRGKFNEIHSLTGCVRPIRILRVLLVIEHLEVRRCPALETKEPSFFDAFNDAVSDSDYIAVAKDIYHEVTPPCGELQVRLQGC